MAPSAERVRLSYPADLSDWGRGIVEDEPFRAYLRRVHDDVAPGDVWAEFVGVGCCGDTLDVPLEVAAVDGSSDADERRGVDDATAFEFEVREACGLSGGWAVQSGAGP